MNQADEWNKQVNHPLQSWEWGEFRGSRQPITRMVQMLVVWSKIPLTPWYFGYVPMGKWPEQIDLNKLMAEGKRRGAVGIRFEPNIEISKVINIDERLVPGRHLFKTKTWLWNLAPSEEEMLNKMHPKGRYNIKVAQKHGVSVRRSDRDEDFEKYLDLMFSGTTKRQGIYAHQRDYHRQMWKYLKGSVASLWVAELDGKILAADLIFRFKDTIYYAYGASALEHKETMAPTLLLWKIAKWGKSEKARCFDLWGAEEGKGFSRFKEQFGTELVEMAGTFDLPVNKFIYKLFRISEGVRWKILRLWK